MESKKEEEKKGRVSRRILKGGPRGNYNPDNRKKKGNVVSPPEHPEGCPDGEVVMVVS
tara:strand:+ start:232 stop:405 length:174 start_codon:yes stop_codon:yes gene_type:complete